MQVSKEIQVDYGHTLPNHYGFCNQIHGHRARIVATVQGHYENKEGTEQGMVLDFKFLKEIMMNKIHGVLDHGFAIWKDDTREIEVTLSEVQKNRIMEDTINIETLEFIKARNEKVLITELPPTAEVLAKWAFRQIKSELPQGIVLVSVMWYETPNSFATCTDCLSE